MTGSDNYFILAGNGSYNNRGCEAIVRGTVAILERYFDQPRFLVFSYYQKQEHYLHQQKVEYDKRISHKGLVYAKRYSLSWAGKQFLQRAAPDSYYWRSHKEIANTFSCAKAVLSIGGDNYSLDYGLPRMLLALNRIILESKKPLVIWGASVGPFSKYPKFEKIILKNLKKTIIFSRENDTIDYLAAHGLKDNVYRVADPAFLMETRVPALEKLPFKIEQGGIGLNLSPLLAKYITGGNMKAWIKKASSMIAIIVQEFKRPVYLIPHVTVPGSDDYLFMQQVKSLLKNKNNINLIPPIFNAAETKWIIGKMHIFAGARIHAIIAALSSGVPALSFSYSIKSSGINKDFFDDNNLMVSSSQFKNDEILGKVNFILENYHDINRQILFRLPEIKRKAYAAGEYLDSICRGSF